MCWSILGLSNQVFCPRFTCEIIPIDAGIDVADFQLMFSDDSRQDKLPEFRVSIQRDISENYRFINFQGLQALALCLHASLNKLIGYVPTWTLFDFYAVALMSWVQPGARKFLVMSYHGYYYAVSMGESGIPQK